MSLNKLKYNRGKIVTTFMASKKKKKKKKKRIVTLTHSNTSICARIFSLAIFILVKRLETIKKGECE